jgi:tripartite-type tricarboxylate transporter receptor subunit TctC
LFFLLAHAEAPMGANLKRSTSTRLCALLAAALLLGSPLGARAQNYPDRPVRMIIAFSAGGSIDALGRILAQKLSALWGENVVVENRPGVLRR